MFFFLFYLFSPVHQNTHRRIYKTILRAVLLEQNIKLPQTKKIIYEGNKHMFLATYSIKEHIHDVENGWMGEILYYCYALCVYNCGKQIISV